MVAYSFCDIYLVNYIKLYKYKKHTEAFFSVHNLECLEFWVLID